MDLSFDDSVISYVDKPAIAALFAVIPARPVSPFPVIILLITPAVIKLRAH